MVMLDDPLEKWMEDIGYGCFQIRLLGLCAVGYFAVCAEMLVTVFIEKSVMDYYNLSTSNFAFLPFCVNAASFVSCFYLGYLSDIVGRKWLFASGILIVAVFGLASACSTSWLCLILCRCAVGIGNGCLTVVDYVVFIECTPVSHRGRYSMVVFVGGCLGVLYVAGLATWMLPAFDTVESWRILLILACLPMVFTLRLRFLFASETPRYLASKGRHAEAYAVLLEMARSNRSDLQNIPSCEEFVEQMQSLEERVPQAIASCSEEQAPEQTSTNWMAPDHRGRLLCNRANQEDSSRLTRFRLTVPLTVVWFLQSTTYWGFTLFLPVFLTNCSVPSSLTIFCMIAAELPGGVAAALMMDRLGRFCTLRVFLALATLFAALTTVASALHKSTLSAQIFLMVGSVGIYMFLIPIWSVLFMLTPEAYPVHLRARASGFFQTIQGIPGFFTPFLSASLARQSHAWHYMLLWSCVLLINLVVAIFLLPNRRWNASRLVEVSLPDH